MESVACRSWFGHKFEAVYTQVEAPRDTSGMNVKSANTDAFKVLLNLNRTYYHGHVCVRCGVVVNQSEDG